MRGLRPTLGAAGSLLAAAAALWLLASALLGFHAWPGGPGDDAPGVARLTAPPVAVRATATPERRVARPRRRARASAPPARLRGAIAPRARLRPAASPTPSSPPPAPPVASVAPAPTAPPAATPTPGRVTQAVAPVVTVLPAPVQTVVSDVAATVDGVLDATAH
jgi:hypothetical protein